METEALMLGIWKNVSDLETSISLPELESIIRESRDKEMRHHKFLAAIQGIDLDKPSNDGEDRVEAAKRRVAAQQAGKSTVEAEYAEIEMDYEVEE